MGILAGGGDVPVSAAMRRGTSQGSSQS